MCDALAFGLQLSSDECASQSDRCKARKTKMNTEIRWQLQLLRVNPSKLHEEKHRSQRVKPEKQLWKQRSFNGI